MTPARANELVGLEFWRQKGPAPRLGPHHSGPPARPTRPRAAPAARRALAGSARVSVEGAGTGEHHSAGAGAAAGVRAGAGLRPPGDAQEAAALQAALFESARDDMRRAHLAAQAEQLQQVADDATVDQFIRHAESGFFGDDEEADCPFVWDGDC